MENLRRRGFLKALLGVGLAAACGLKVNDAFAEELGKGTPASGPGAAGAAEAVEGVEAGLEPNQFFVRRRRFRRRRVIFFRPRRRRRVVYLYRRPRYRFVRFRRRRW